MTSPKCDKKMSMRMEQSDLDKLDLMCEQDKRSRANLIRQLIDREFLRRRSLKVDYELKTTPKDNYGDADYDEIIRDIADTMMYDILEDIEKGMKDGYVESRKDIDPEGMFSYAWEVFENYIMDALRQQVVNMLEDVI